VRRNLYIGGPGCRPGHNEKGSRGIMAHDSRSTAPASLSHTATSTGAATAATSQPDSAAAAGATTAAEAIVKIRQVCPHLQCS
jgi:hypothetical protein